MAGAGALHLLRGKEGGAGEDVVRGLPGEGADAGMGEEEEVRRTGDFIRHGKGDRVTTGDLIRHGRAVTPSPKGKAFGRMWRLVSAKRSESFRAATEAMKENEL